jgi:hypothetical protein
MKLKNKYIDELIALRAEARRSFDWSLSDRIRDYLDTKYVFVFDNDQEQIVYHRSGGSRRELIHELKAENRAHKHFEAWLHSTNSSIKKI